MNVLSLFDGLSGAQIALNRLGIKVDKYFAAEIDKYAIEQQKIIGDLRDGLMRALDWNWLDEDYPKELFDELYGKATMGVQND